MSTIEVIALKPFIYSTDGYTEIPVREHETFDLPEHLFDGLNGARYVRRATIGDGKVALKAEAPKIPEEKVSAIADTAIKLRDALVEMTEKKVSVPETAYLRTAEPRVEQSAVEIPDDWKTLKWFALRSLASRVSDTPIKTMEDAVAAIETELARRG